MLWCTAQISPTLNILVPANSVVLQSSVILFSRAFCGPVHMEDHCVEELILLGTAFSQRQIEAGEKYTSFLSP